MVGPNLCFLLFFVISIALEQKKADFRRPEAHLRGFRRVLEASRAGFDGLLGFPSFFLLVLDAKMLKISRFLTPSWGPSWSPKITCLV